MNKTKIEWCDYTWNPIMGCLNNCSWCWARRMNDRFQFIPDFNMPVFFPGRLKEPETLKVPSRIAVCLMGDVFSPGVCDEWINRVLLTIRQNDQHQFMLLTKFPQRYYDFIIPSNCWLGTSISCMEEVWRLEILSGITCKFPKFLSIEPLLGPMHDADLTMMDHVYVGAQTGPGAMIPQNDWIQSIKHPNILWKNNIKKYL
ncbi:MAG: DUF5131 family protein [Bacteroidales bacterium]